MIALWNAFNFFICLTLTRSDAVICVTYVESGKSVTINPNVSGETLEDIMWTYNGNKVAENNLAQLQEYGQFKGRTEIHISTGQLTVHNMTNSDSGVYQSVIQINGKLQHSEHDVKVIDPVPQPKVSCELNHTAELRTLFCSLESQFPVIYEWSGSNATQQSGQELHIGNEENLDSVYTCTVKNQVSQNNTSFLLKDCNTDGSQLDLITIIIVIIVIIIIIIIIIIISVIVVKTFEQAKYADAEENREQEISEDRKEFANNDDSMNAESQLDGNATCAGENSPLVIHEEDLTEQVCLHEYGKDSEQRITDRDNGEENNDQEICPDTDKSVIKYDDAGNMNIDNVLDENSVSTDETKLKMTMKNMRISLNRAVIQQQQN